MQLPDAHQESILSLEEMLLCPLPARLPFPQQTNRQLENHCLPWSPKSSLALLAKERSENVIKGSVLSVKTNSVSNGRQQNLQNVDAGIEPPSISVSDTDMKGGRALNTTHFQSERQRREFLNDKYHSLRSLVPNPTKADRASIVQDAINYVQELKHQVHELQRLKASMQRRTVGWKRRKLHVDSDTSVAPARGPSSNNGSDDSNLQTNARLQRVSSYGTTVDVRIVEDEVTILLTQDGLTNTLLSAVAALQRFQLDLSHAGGGRIMDQNVYIFHAKVSEGVTMPAQQLANEILKQLDPPVRVASSQETM